jgi:hypothetical protein
MTADTIAISGTAAIITTAYFIAGIGTARMAAKCSEREFRFFDVAAWPIVLGVFALWGGTT